MVSNSTVSPYSVKSLDDAIAHLERVIGDEHAQMLFAPDYWHRRIRQMQATPGIMHAQLHRLHRLLNLLGCATPSMIQGHRGQDAAKTKSASVALDAIRRVRQAHA
ncbi:hypothetical protein PTKU15_24770 [Paraburkholderia terrae]|nr:hypothetical protein PTKU15_24770 [Paraburkholderia terrae]